MVLILYLAAGALAGFLAGLLGVGGGIIVVPVLIVAFETQGFPDQVLIHLAIGTSLASIIFTSASAVFNHHRKQAVRWQILKPMLVGIIAGSILGVLIVVRIDGDTLKQLIGLFAMLVALKMAFNPAIDGGHAIPGKVALGRFGLLAGGVSSMFGIGGGTLTVPYLSRLKMPMHQVIGTASACGFPIAVVGALTNMLVGMDVEGRPLGSIGFVYLPALAGVALASIFCARLGVRVAHALPALLLRRVFAGALFIVGLRFLISS